MIVWAFWVTVWMLSCTQNTSEKAPKQPTTVASKPSADAKAPKTPHVVIIVVDGMRHDRTGFGGNKNPATPNIDHFAKSGVIFDYAFSQSNESLTSHASMFTGAYPSELAWPDYLQYLIPEKHTVLAEVMQAMGYDTSAFVAGGHVKSIYGFEQGFATFKEGRDFSSFFDTVPMAKQWLEKRGDTEKPFFMFLHGYDLHRPYGKDSVFFHPFGRTEHEGIVDNKVTRRSFTERTYKKVFYHKFRHPRTYHSNGERILDPTSYRKMQEGVDKQTDSRGIFPLSEEDIEHVREHYDASALAADTYVGLFLEELEKRGLLQNTVVIITSDHGEGLQEHAVSNHRMGLYDTTTRVPMVIGGAIPDAWRGTRRSEIVAAIDIVPTITDIVGTVPIAGGHGRSLWALLQGKDIAALPGVYQEGVIGHIALRTQEWRLVFDGLALVRPELDKELAELPIDGGRFLLFHTAKDPFEQTNLVSKNKQKAEELRAKLIEIRRTKRSGTERMKPSKKIQDMLKSKGGYF